MPDNASIADVVAKADEIAPAAARPVIVDVGIDYSKRTAFTTGNRQDQLRALPLRPEDAHPDPRRGAACGRIAPRTPLPP